MKIESTIFDLLATGKLGNTVGQRARGGIKYLRSRITPANPKTAAQSVIRNLISSLAGHWKETLSHVQRDAWDAYAAAVPQDGVLITGQNYYVGANALRGQVNAEAADTPLQTVRLDAAPTTFSQAVLSPLLPTMDADGETLSVAFNTADAWANDDTGNAALVLWASAPTSPSVTFNDKGTPWADHVRSLIGASPIGSPRDFTLPAPGQTGDNFFLTFRALNADGRYSPPQNFVVTVPA